MQRVNMDLNKDLWKRVGIRAAEEGTTKRMLVEKALKRYLKKEVRMKRYALIDMNEGDETVLVTGAEEQVMEYWHKEKEELLSFMLTSDSMDDRKVAQGWVDGIDGLQGLAKVDWSWWRLEVREIDQESLTHKNLRYAYEATNSDPDYSDLELEAEGVRYLIRNVPYPAGWDGESDWTDEDDYIDKVILKRIATKEYEVYMDGEWCQAE